MRVGPFDCSKCGATENGSWEDDTARALVTTGLCFQCKFWHDITREVARGTTFIVAGEGYTPGSESGGGDFGFRGFGGAKFRFRVNGGPERTSTNMWFRGPVPTVWRADLPDNAAFVRERIPAGPKTP